MSGNILYISNVGIKKMTGAFAGTAIAVAKEADLSFYSLANRTKMSEEQLKADEQKFGIRLLHADIERDPFSLKNIRAYKQTVRIIKDNDIDYIHCNTPIGGVLGRLAGKKCKVKKVIYQAHGFHFYKGAPLKNWLIYYPIECLLAHLTDAIITINKEDHERAQKLKLRKNGKVYYVHGVGMDTEKYSVHADRDEIRKRLGLCESDFAFISMGELNGEKNYSSAIKAVAEANDTRIKYFICGIGPKENELKQLIEELGLQNSVFLLGYRNDISDLLTGVDAFLFTSKREGLARSLMEAMAAGLPCVVSDIRGNNDLIDDGKGGFLCREGEYADAMKKIVDDEEKRREMREYNLKKINNFDVATVKGELEVIYREVFCNT